MKKNEYICACVYTYVCIHIKPSHFAVDQKPMQCCKSTTLQKNLEKTHMFEIHTQLGNISYTHIIFFPWKVL